jgi:hypothetical protein
MHVDRSAHSNCAVLLLPVHLYCLAKSWTTNDHSRECCIKRGIKTGIPMDEVFEDGIADDVMIAAVKKYENITEEMKLKVEELALDNLTYD